MEGGNDNNAEDVIAIVSDNDEDEQQLEGRRAVAPPPPLVNVTGVRHPQKKKVKMTEDDEEGGGGSSETSGESIRTLSDAVKAIHELQADHKKLKTRHAKLERETGEMRDILEHALGFSLTRRIDARHRVELKFKPGYEPARTLSGVTFRDDEGGARYPGMDREPYEPPAPDASASKKKRNTLSKKDAVVVVIEQPKSATEVLSVPYYVAMEQVQINTERLHYLNEQILPLLEKNQLVMAALAERTGAPRLQESLRIPIPEEQGSRAFVWSDPHAPHLNLEVVSKQAAKDTAKERAAEEKAEASEKRTENLSMQRIQREVSDARTKVAEIARAMTFSGGGDGSGGGSLAGSSGDRGALFALQTELTKLRKDVEDLKKAEETRGLTGFFGDDAFMI